jgi:hypothetical protein
VTLAHRADGDDGCLGYAGANVAVDYVRACGRVVHLADHVAHVHNDGAHHVCGIDGASDRI